MYNAFCKSSFRKRAFDLNNFDSSKQSEVKWTPTFPKFPTPYSWMECGCQVSTMAKKRAKIF